MDNKRIYTIQINGIQESVTAVEALNKELNDLEKRIKALESSNVNVNATSKSGGGNASALSEEEAIQREINKLKAEGANLDAKIVAAQDEIYKKVDATKQLYKETVADQKAMAAEERLIANTYSNTMQGMKAHLADLKAAINTTDLGDTEKISQMTKEANELSNKLKEMEQAYGQFGRNVGNYAEGVAEGMQKVKVQVGDSVREFSNAREASRTLNNELKAMAVNGQSNTKEYKELRQAVMELESTFNDAKKPMDNLMDTMQSIVAIGSLTQSFSALFGFDDSEIQRSIQKLVALQNILNSINTLNNQIQTREGIGGWIKKASSAMDAFAASITKTDKAAKGLALSLKVLSGIAILATIIALTKALSDYTKSQKEASKATEDGLKAYAKAESELTVLQKRLNDFNGTKKQEKKLVDELNSKYGTSLGQYKSLKEWKDALIKKGKVYCQVLQKEAEMQALMNIYTENYIKLQKARQAQEEGNQDTVDLILKMLDGQATVRQVLASIRDDIKAPLSDDINEYNNELDREIHELEEKNKKILEDVEKLQTDIDELNKNNKLNDYSDQIDKNTDKTKKSLEEGQKSINQLEVRLMQEGLNKKLRQLDEEERQTINKLKENGRKSADAIKKTQQYYSQLRQKEINDYLKNLELSIKKTADNISNVKIEINIKDIDNKIGELQNKFEKLSMDKPIKNTLIGKIDMKDIFKDIDKEDFNITKKYLDLFDESEMTKDATKFYKFLIDFIKQQNTEVQKELMNIYNTTDGDEKTKQKAFFDKATEMFEESYEKELLIARNYTREIDETLESSFGRRLAAQRNYDESIREELVKSINQQGELTKKRILEEEKAATLSENSRYESVQLPLEKQKDDLEKTLKAFSATTKKEEESYNELKNALDRINKQMEEQYQQHIDKLSQIGDEYNNRLEQNEINTAKERSAVQEKYFDEQIANFSDMVSKVNEILNKQPTYNALGIVNISETKKQYKEIEQATQTTVANITKEKLKLEYLWKKGLITPEAKNSITQQLNDLEAQVKQLLQVITNEVNDVIPKFVQSMQVYINGVVDSFSTIMSAVWDAEDAAFDKEQEEIDKANDALEKALDKQQEIVEQHKNAIDSIEDELATSRGDRRQHLIDQLNAEIEAQRTAQKEKERIERQQEAQQKRQDALDKKRKKAEYNRNLTQAIVNGAMAVTMAAINKWPVPAIPMMALAASTTAAQIAIMAANKPYAKGGQLDGGVAQGKRHSEGGIPVLGGRASIEGGEFITNRQTTAKNVDLLEYINAKHRKLNIDDFIDFYSSGKVKKNIMSSSPRSKFADGGTIPTLSNTYTFDDRLIDAFEKYAERPSVVSVVDINSRQAAVKNVQVLAGISDK